MGGDGEGGDAWWITHHHSSPSPECNQTKSQGEGEGEQMID